MHRANTDEVRSLYEAVQRLRSDGHRVVLVKSGWNTVPSSELPKLGEGIQDLGWIGRSRVFELLQAADILVRPGAPGPFNHYRFPSKLPEFLASGRPVVLPKTNLGLHLKEGAEAFCSSSEAMRTRSVNASRSSMQTRIFAWSSGDAGGTSRRANLGGPRA